MFRPLENLGCGVILLYGLMGLIGLWLLVGVLPYAFAAVVLFVSFVVMLVIFILTTVLPYLLMALAVALVIAGLVWLVKRILR